MTREGQSTKSRTANQFLNEWRWVESVGMAVVDIFEFLVGNPDKMPLGLKKGGG